MPVGISGAHVHRIRQRPLKRAGYLFFPLFVAALFLGPVGWALVLVAVTIGAGPRLKKPPVNPQVPYFTRAPTVHDAPTVAKRGGEP